MQDILRGARLGRIPQLEVLPRPQRKGLARRLLSRAAPRAALPSLSQRSSCGSTHDAFPTNAPPGRRPSQPQPLNAWEPLQLLVAKVLANALSKFHEQW